MRSSDFCTSGRFRSPNLGVFWLERGPQPIPGPPVAPRRGGFLAAPQNVFVTRLHVRYDNAHFPEDLVFQQTADRENFQARYVLRHPWTGEGACPAATQYRQELPQRQEREAQTLASLTGWHINDIRRKMGVTTAAQTDSPVKWWDRLWR